MSSLYLSHIKLTVPMAFRIAFLMMPAKSSMNSMEVDHGSKQVVMMYFTPSLFFGFSSRRDKNKTIKYQTKAGSHYLTNV